MDTHVPNPLNLGQSLKRPLEGQQSEEALPKQPVLPRDSAVTMAEKVTGNGLENGDSHVHSPLESPSKKRTKLDHTEAPKVDTRDKVKGVALVKAE